MGTIAQLEMAASSDLLWALTKHGNCFKYSGLANEEAVGVEECPRGITLKKKNKKNAMAPKRNVVSIDLKKDFRKVAQTIKNKTEGAYYRRDLTKAAQARWYKIWKSQNKGEVSKD